MYFTFQVIKSVVKKEVERKMAHKVYRLSAGAKSKPKGQAYGTGGAQWKNQRT